MDPNAPLYASIGSFIDNFQLTRFLYNLSLNPTVPTGDLIGNFNSSHFLS